MRINRVIVFATAAISVGLLGGCGSGDQTVLAPSAKDVSDLASLRTIFDRVHGDQSKLTPEEKKQFMDYSKGDAAQMNRMWSFMQNPKGGGAPPKNHAFEAGAQGGIYPSGGAGGG